MIVLGEPRCRSEASICMDRIDIYGLEKEIDGEVSAALNRIPKIFLEILKQVWFTQIV